jgi:hypothetical protein
MLLCNEDLKKHLVLKTVIFVPALFFRLYGRYWAASSVHPYYYTHDFHAFLSFSFLLCFCLIIIVFSFVFLSHLPNLLSSFYYFILF